MRPLANVASVVTKPPENDSNDPLRNRRFFGASVILAVAIGIVLVLLVDWLNSLAD